MGEKGGSATGHPVHCRIPKEFIFDRNKNLVVTSPGHSQQPVSPQDFFLMAWLANVTTRFFSHGPCQMPPQDFLTVAAICFLAHSPQRGNTVTSWYSGEFWCWINPAVSPQDFFSPGPAGPCHHRIFFRRNRLGHVTTRFLFALIRMGCVTTRLFHIPK